jgi:hypothetical protein
LVAPIAASVLGLGIGAFCKHHGEDKSSSWILNHNKVTKKESWTSYSYMLHVGY